MIDKRSIPLDRLKILKVLYNLKSDYFESTILSDGSIIYVDLSSDSGFRFLIDINKFLTNETYYYVSACPASKSNVLESDIFINKAGGIPTELAILQNAIDNWENIIKEYNEITLFEDDFISDNHHKYYDDFELIDDVSNDKPLSEKQILALDIHLTEIVNSINNYSNEYNSAEINGIIDSSLDLKKQLGILDKKTVVKKLTEIWSKMTKGGADIIKEFLSEAKKELIKTVVKAAIEHGPALIEHLINKPT